MAEEIIEFNGAGFIPGVPGEFANCKVTFDADTKEVLRVEPLGTGPASVTTSSGPITISVYAIPPDTSAQPVEQSSEPTANEPQNIPNPIPEDNQGG